MTELKSTEKEKVVKAYYTGFEKHDWSGVVSQLAEDFTFTSPNNDDHIPIEEFKERCWGTNSFFQKVNYIKIAENEHDLMLLVEIITTTNKVIRNVDIFSFSDGKIKSIEVFFGPGAWYPGSH
jgi:ketosteroid isomerase-like protein